MPLSAFEKKWQNAFFSHNFQIAYIGNDYFKETQWG